MSTKTSSPNTVETTSLEANREKERLVEEICFLKDQKAALDRCLSDRTARLKMLMADAGNRRVKTEAGTASFYVQTVYSVHSKDMLCHLFTKSALVKICKPSKAFVEAARRCGTNVAEAITEGVDERFKVERARTKAAREAQKEQIEQNADKIEQKIADFVTAMEE